MVIPDHSRGKQRITAEPSSGSATCRKFQRRLKDERWKHELLGFAEEENVFLRVQLRVTNGKKGCLILRVLAKATDYSPKAPRSIRSPYLNQPWKKQSGIHFGSGRLVHFRPARTAPDGISERLAESVKKAEEMCESNPDTGECAASWDEVEELSAAASHARDRKKAEAADPLEAFCKDNPETKECRTYED